MKSQLKMLIGIVGLCWFCSEAVMANEYDPSFEPHSEWRYVSRTGWRKFTKIGSMRYDWDYFRRAYSHYGYRRPNYGYYRR